MAHLEHHRRYPARARARHQEGTATVRFTIDRDGKVSGAALVTSSGYAALDEETLALLERASPVPPPPDAGAGQMDLVVPVQYRLR